MAVRCLEFPEFPTSLLVMGKATSKLLISQNSLSEDRESYGTAALGSKNSQEVQSLSPPFSLLTPYTPKGKDKTDDRKIPSQKSQLPGKEGGSRKYPCSDGSGAGKWVCVWKANSQSPRSGVRRVKGSCSKQISRPESRCRRRGRMEPWA